MVFHDHRHRPHPRPDREFAKLLPFRKVEAHVGRLTASTLDVTDPQFGAAGDGVTDDSAAFQDALDQAESPNGGLVVAGGPPGTTYLVESEIVVGRRTELRVPSGVTIKRETSTDDSVVNLNRNNATLSGTGVVQSDVVTDNGVLSIGSDSTAVQWCRVTGISVHGPGETTAGGVGVYLYPHNGATGATFQNVVTAEIHDVETAVKAEDGANGNEFQNCELWNIGDVAFHLIGGQNRVLGGFVHSSETGMTVLDLDGTHNTLVVGLSAEPGAGSVGYSIDASCTSTTIVAGLNTATRGTDASDDANIIDRGEVISPLVRPTAPDGSAPLDVYGSGSSPSVRVLANGTGYGEIRLGDGTSAPSVSVRTSATGNFVFDDGLQANSDFWHFGSKAGFFGTAPITQPSVPAAGTVTADDLRQALIDLGLVS